MSKIFLIFLESFLEPLRLTLIFLFKLNAIFLLMRAIYSRNQLHLFLFYFIKLSLKSFLKVLNLNFFFHFSLPIINKHFLMIIKTILKDLNIIHKFQLIFHKILSHL